MKCPNCNKEVADGSKFCPDCGYNFSQPQSQAQSQQIPGQSQNVYVQPNQQEPKKKMALWKKILIGVAVVFVLFIAMGSCSSDSSSSDSGSASTTPSSSSSSSSDSSSSTGSSSTSSGSTPAAIYNKISQITTVDFTINSKALSFINAHPDLFPAKSDVDCNNYINYGIEYKHLAKSADNYGDSMVCVSGSVVQIKELKPEDTGLNSIVTMMIVTDYNYNYYCAFYIGTKDVFEDDEVTIYGVPLNMGSYENLMNGTTECAVVAASYVSPQVGG